STPTHLIDIMATCVDLGGASYPTEYNGNQIHPMEGVSLAPIFRGEALERPQPLFWEHEGNRAIRMGDWKLVSKHPGGWELYNIPADRTEMHDLAKDQPERVKEMSALWEKKKKRVGVLPWPINGGEGKGKGKKNKKK
ncbi:MAG: arylsulfatase, partial [Verrucomicrobiales bacterium]|nr:arylsulfatase [Verrucomicrobiales bacterium]